MITGIALYIVVMINGEEYEAIPQVYQSVEACVDAERQYTKEIVVRSGCFAFAQGTFKINDSVNSFSH